MAVCSVPALGIELGGCKEVTFVSSPLFADYVQISLILATEITSPSGCVFFIMK